MSVKGCWLKGMRSRRLSRSAFRMRIFVNAGDNVRQKKESRLTRITFGDLRPEFVKISPTAQTVEKCSSPNMPV